MTDRELLEFAAKAAGIEVYESSDGTIQNRPILAFQAGGRMGTMPYEVQWNPLLEDAQAFRLAVKLNMAISIHDNHCTACAQTGFMRTVQDMPTDAATRRAIVLAAAAIGKDLP